ncbi:MAG TPA: ferrochelatase, partial [Nitrospiraceae bacterium]|nr:ferrochelatase [Nitrospiraceae bacterium]
IGGKSPILDITIAQAKALEESLNSSRFTVHGSRLFKVYVGM